MEAKYVKKMNFIISTIYILLIGLIIYTILKYGLGLISPFIFSFVIAYFLRKPAQFISSKFKLSPKLVFVVLVFIFYSTIGVLLSLLGIKLISEVNELIFKLPLIYENQFEPFLNSTFDGIEKTVYLLDPTFVEYLNKGFDQFVNSLGDNITKISLSLVGTISSIASSLPVFLIKILLMIICTFFIASDYDAMSKFAYRQFSDKVRVIILRIKQYIINTLFVVIRSYILIMLITFVELSIGLSIIRIPNAILIALIIALFDILPVLGTGGVMIPWILISLFQGNYTIALGLLIIYVAVTIIRNVIEPKIVGGQLGLHPVITLMSMFVGLNLFGVIGLFGFPITLSFLKHLNDTETIKLFK